MFFVLVCEVDELLEVVCGCSCWCELFEVLVFFYPALDGFFVDGVACVVVECFLDEVAGYPCVWDEVVCFVVFPGLGWGGVFECLGDLCGDVVCFVCHGGCPVVCGDVVCVVFEPGE